MAMVTMKQQLEEDRERVEREHRRERRASDRCSAPAYEHAKTEPAVIAEQDEHRPLRRRGTVAETRHRRDQQQARADRR